MMMQPCPVCKRKVYVILCSGNPPNLCHSCFLDQHKETQRLLKDIEKKAKS